MNSIKTPLFPEIARLVDTLDPTEISAERQLILQELIDYIQSKVSNGGDVRINFICTHNSRRSHLSQVWAQTMANYFMINNVYCYSGGTEATALYPMVAKTLESSGFKVATISEGNNPVYAISYGNNQHPVIGFSKRFDDDFNPKSGFAAVMTCDSANEACPLVVGAEKRIAITYQDPKAFDHTPQQVAKYNERSLQIATEMHHVFSKINL